MSKLLEGIARSHSRVRSILEAPEAASALNRGQSAKLQALKDQAVENERLHQKGIRFRKDVRYFWVRENRLAKKYKVDQAIDYVMDHPSTVKVGELILREEAAPPRPVKGKEEKLWAGTLQRAVMQQDGKMLRALALALIKQGLQGDVSALKEIGDRLDGKTVAQVEAKIEATIKVTSDDVNL